MGSPVGARKDREPERYDPGPERGMLVAEPGLTRPPDELADILMNVLAALGDQRIERPRRNEADDARRSGAVTPQRISQGVEEADNRPRRCTLLIKRRRRCKQGAP